jgi:N-acetylmuramoyl-L-alanine amidase
MYKYNFEEQLITENKYSRPGETRELTLGIVWHWTGKAGQGRTGVARYFELLHNQDSGGDPKKLRYASTPLIVGPGGITRVMDLTEIHYHAGGIYTDLAKTVLPAWATTNADRYHTPNMVMLGVEMIVEDDGTIDPVTIERSAELGAWLTRVYNLEVKDHYRHYDITGKMCPRPWVDDPGDWRSFLRRIKQLMESGEEDDARGFEA